MLVLLLVLGIASGALAAMPTVWTLGAGLVIAGAAIAPLFGLLYASMGVVAPDATLTEAFTWETSAITGGIALGSAAAGVMAGSIAPPTTFLVAGAAFLFGALALRLLRSTLS
jgi:predicted MFS family arabinose efflux permease